MITLLNLSALALAKATPLFLACVGGLLSEVGGVINFALEGMMLTGAFVAVWATYVSGSPLIGLLAGAGGGMGIGLIHAVASLGFKANQIVSSIAINLLSLGVTGMLLNQIFSVYGTSPTVPGLPDLGGAMTAFLPLSAGHFPGPIARLSIMVVAAILIAVLLPFFINHTTWGLRLRACGENPLAAKAAGLAVGRIRFLAVLVGGAFAGMGGAYISIGELSQFVEHMTHGSGYLAIAALILGRWRPIGIIASCLLFGLSESLSEWFSVRLPELPYQLFLALPYVICLIVLMIHLGRGRPPSALGR